MNRICYRNWAKFPGWFVLILIWSFLQTIAFADSEVEIKGMIESLGADSLVVQGTTIFVNDQTRFEAEGVDSLKFEDLSVGDLVEVEAERQSDSSLLALKVKLTVEKEKVEEFEIKGKISALGTDSLVVSGWVVYVNNQTMIEGHEHQMLSFSDLQMGDFVEIKAVFQSDSSLLATRIELKDQEEDEFEIKGQVDSKDSSAFVVNGIYFQVDANTQFKGKHDMSFSFSDLQVGDWVEVKALPITDSTYLALKVKLEDDFSQEQEISAPIDSIGNDFIVVAGVTFAVDSATEILNHHRQPITLADLQVGMIVEVKAVSRNSGGYYAKRIKVEDFWRDEVEVTGTIDSLGSNWLLVSGQKFYVTDTTEILNGSHIPISFLDLTIGLRVEVKAKLDSSSRLIALKIKLEDNAQDEIELSGQIDSLGTNYLWISGQQFFVDANTLIYDYVNSPITFGDLQVGDRVELKAILQTDGSLLAIKIKIEDRSGFSQVDGIVTGVSNQTLSVGNFQLSITSSTVVLDNNYQPTSLSTLSPGQSVSVWIDASQPQQPQALQVKENALQSPTSITDKINPGIIGDYQLYQNFPNPFNPVTNIRFAVKQRSKVRIRVFNILGEQVTQIFNGIATPGVHQIQFQASGLPSGIYFYALEVNGRLVSTKRMMLIK